MPENIENIKDLLISCANHLKAINPELVKLSLVSSTALDFDEYNYKNYPDESFGEILAYLRNMKPKDAYEAVHMAWDILNGRHLHV